MTRASRKGPSRKQPRKSRKALTLIIGFFLLSLSVRAVLGEKGLIATWRKQAEVREVEEKVRILKLKNGRLRAEVEQLQRGGYAIEKIAREDLGMALPGEFVFLLPRETAESAPPE